MFKMKRVAAMAALCAAAASPTAFAGWSGNVGAVSEYMFRGIPQGDGGEPAIQGGIDYAADSGFYLGTWGSNVDWGAGDTELDLYAGFGGETSGGVGYDFGVVYYYYPEEDEEGFDPSANTTEIYGSLSFGMFSLGYYGAVGDYFGVEADLSHYVNGSFSAPLSDKTSLDIAIGYSFGDAFEGDDGAEDTDYIDYSLGISTAIDDSLSASFAIVVTDIDDDDPKFVLGLSKSFDL